MSAPSEAVTNTAEIPELDALEASPDELAQVVRHKKPVIVRNVVKRWPAFAQWSFDGLSKTYGSREYDCQLNLPTDVPTKYLSRDFTKRMRLDEFIALIPNTRYDSPCYLHQRPIQQFPGLENDVRFEEMTCGLDPNPFINMWIGSAGTKSSLHFDFQDGLLAQVKGRKRFFMVDPTETRWLAQIPGVIQKSQVDPEAPDYEAFPRSCRARFLIGDVREGDLIYIPRGWWHAVRAYDASISVNYFFGASMGFFDRLSYVTAGGWRTWTAVLRDFAWHGVLRKQLPGRLYASEPFGVWFYNQVVGYWRKRLRLKGVSVPAGSAAG